MHTGVLAWQSLILFHNDSVKRNVLFLLYLYYFMEINARRRSSQNDGAFSDVSK